MGSFLLSRGLCLAALLLVCVIGFAHPVHADPNAAPNEPSALAPADGSTTSTHQPLLTFTLTDPDIADVLSYNIRIDDSADYSSPIIHYISGSQAQGAQSYRIGQPGGSYLTGSEGITLPDGVYYWTIRSSDSADVSSFVTANGGAAAFTVLTGNSTPVVSNLGPSDLVDMSATTTNTPIFSFFLSDADGADTLKYTIQIDDNNDYSSPVVDYTSALGAQGTSTFQVGQLPGGGTYTTGTTGQVLDAQDFYWRVRVIDSQSAVSAYNIANGGSAAFSVIGVNFDPNNPTGLIPASGATTSTGNPILRFDMTDNNGGDLLLYEVQIDDDPDFMSPLVDYSSGYGAQGGRLFQVGQATGTGSYVVGYAGQALTDGAYYWRVNSFDSVSSSGYVYAHGGAVAFQVVISNNPPTTPAGLGPATMVNGSATTTNTPYFSFTLADTDVLDTVRYQIQIDDSSDFGSPIVDYLSALDAQGAFTFAVGQATSTGNYVVGYAGQVLGIGDYYWRVRTIDSSDEPSLYATANTGMSAFHVVAANRAPNVPSALGPMDLVDGSTTSTPTPTFSFTISDPDGADTLSYAIVIDDSADFGSPVVQYVSDLEPQGVKTFRVGQATGTGVYVVGYAGQMLSNADYYWAIVAFDQDDASSSTAANHGSVAFVVDAALPVVEFEMSSGTGSESVAATSVRIILSGASASSVTVSYAVTSGTALGTGVDYTLVPDTVTIPAGQTSTTISFTVLDDGLAESNETFVISLSSATGATIGARDTYTYTILDDDTAGATFSTSSLSVTEGGVDQVYTLVLTSQPTTTVQILLSTTSTQFSLSTSTLTFTSSNWNTPQTVTTTGVNDSTYETTQVGSIAHTASSTGSDYPSSLTLPMVIVTILDNDPAPTSGGGGGGGGGGSGGGGGGGSSVTNLFFPTTTTTVSTPIGTSTPVVIISPVVTPEPVVIAPVVTNGSCPAVTTAFISTSDRACLLTFLGLPGSDEVAEARALAGVQADAKEFGLKVYGEQLNVYARFIAYGVSKETRQLGERERRAVVRDLMQIIGYSATVQDFHLTTVGQKALTRNFAAEQRQVPIARELFRKMYNQPTPNFKNPKDDLAWNTLLYRIRFTRDLVKEQQGIKQFQFIFKKKPATPLDWSVVRALGYIR